MAVENLKKAYRIGCCHAHMNVMVSVSNVTFVNRSSGNLTFVNGCGDSVTFVNIGSGNLKFVNSCGNMTFVNRCGNLTFVNGKCDL